MGQQDCETMRENITKVSPEIDGERFDGKWGARVTDCYVTPGVEGCQQLNCYTGPVDAKFRNRAVFFKHRMEACVPQEGERAKDLIDENIENVQENCVAEFGIALSRFNQATALSEAYKG